MRSTVDDTLAMTRGKYPEKEALVYPYKDIRWTFAEFDDNVSRFANVLADRGIEKGDRVSVILRNSAEYAVAIYSIARRGAVFNPINWRLAHHELADILQQTEPNLVLFDEEMRETVDRLRDELHATEYVYVDDDRHETPDFADGFYTLLSSASPHPPGVSVEADDPYAIIYTSGTTGRPKGAVHTHATATTHNLRYIWYWGYTHNDIGVVTKPMFHTAAIHCRLFPQVYVGAKTIIMHEFDAERLLNLVDTEGVTGFALPSRMYRQLLDLVEDMDFDGSTMDRFGYGTSPMPPALLEECMDVFGDGFCTAYGMTEMGPGEVFLFPEDVKTKLGSVGLPSPSTDIRIVPPGDESGSDTANPPANAVDRGEKGEILIRSPCMMERYWRDPEGTDHAIKDGWFYTGDIGFIDEDGFLYLVDRVDDMIISGGENIYPVEVENVLHRHPSVSDVAVIGEEDDEWGQIVSAYVVTSEGVSPTELDAFCQNTDDLADFKRPRRYEFVSELPKNPSGKILKSQLGQDP